MEKGLRMNQNQDYRTHRMVKWFCIVGFGIALIVMLNACAIVEGAGKDIQDLSAGYRHMSSQR